jgi:Cu+-exporting ATPase
MDGSTMAKDPVCGMDVDPSQAAGQSDYNGQTYYFCSKGCKVAFDKDPQSYLNVPGSGEEHGGHN